MHELVVTLALLGIGGLVLFAGAITYARWRVRKQLRMRPSTRSVAPTAWLVSTSEPARLHRRLRRATAIARTAAARGDATIAGLAAEIEDHAVALEVHLVMLSGLWRRERDARRQLIDQVVVLERLSSRLTVSAIEISRPRSLTAGSPDALAELDERLDALDAARHELAQLERSWDLN